MMDDSRAHLLALQRYTRMPIDLFGFYCTWPNFDEDKQRKETKKKTRVSN